MIGSDTALHVETAAYALLALVTEDPVAYSQEARKVVRWLSSRRNGQGGFVSTQVFFFIFLFCKFISGF